jgi:hypothetical protein
MSGVREQGHGGVAQFVRRERLNPDSIADSAQRSAEVVGFPWCADFAGEDKVVVLPRSSEVEALFELAGPVSTER